MNTPAPKTITPASKAITPAPRQDSPDPRHKPLSLSEGGGVPDEGGVGASQAGPAVRARNATTHGLFARDVVLPHLGEDHAAYDALLAQLCEQLPPRSHLERHYLEQIAAASWRLRRLHRWQAQVYEDPTLTEDQRLDRLDKVLRHEVALTRQIDRAVRTLNRDLKWLFDGRARDEALYQRDLTEAEIRAQPELGIEVQRMVWRRRRPLPAWDLADARLDTRVTPEADSSAPEDTKNCQDTKICQNENCQNETDRDPQNGTPPPASGPRDHSPTQAPLPSPRSGRPAARGPEGRGEPTPAEAQKTPAEAGEKTVTRKLDASDYLAYRKREQELYNRFHPDRPDTTDWDDPETQEAYGRQ